MQSTLLKVGEAARILGIAKNTLYIWIRRGEIPVVHINRTIRIHPDTIAAMCADSEVMPVARKGRTP